MFVYITNPSQDEIDSLADVGIFLPTKEQVQTMDLEPYFHNEIPHVVIPLVISEYSDEITTHFMSAVISKNDCYFIVYDKNDLSSKFIDIDFTIFDDIKSGLTAYLILIQNLFQIVKLDSYANIQSKLLSLSNDIFNYKESDKSSRYCLKMLGHLSDHISLLNRFSNITYRSIEFILETYRESLDRYDNYIANNSIEKISKLLKDNDATNTKISFLMDSTLGFINIEQNNTMKILTIVSSVLILPTLIAGIFGMNFTVIPLMSDPYGFYYCVLIMIIMIAIPCYVFKLRGWFNQQ